MYEVKLTNFEGPLDLLLHLIKQKEVEIYDIPISEITEQYLEYLGLMKQLDLDIASEFLVIATTLIQIKSQSILPADEEPEEDISEDAREELIRQLLEYKQFKESALALENKADRHAQVFGRPHELPSEIDGSEEVFIEATLFDLLSVFKITLGGLLDVEPFIEDVEPFIEDEIQAEIITVEEKMDEILNIIHNQDKISFDKLFFEFNTKLEVIVTFLAILELVRLKQIILLQSGLFGDIHIGLCQNSNDM